MRVRLVSLVFLAVLAASRAEASDTTVGLRPEVEATFQGRLGAGLAIEARPAIGETLGLLFRARVASGSFERLHPIIGLRPESRREVSLTAGLSGRLHLAERAWLEGAIAGGVGWTRSVATGGCLPPAVCLLGLAAPVVDRIETLGAIGEASVGAIWMLGEGWGVDLSCTFALGGDEPKLDRFEMTTGLTMRAGAGLRAALP
jgi:hypothetical protein